MTPIREIDQLREKQLIDETKFESNDNILDIPIKSVEYKGKFNAQDDVEVKLLTADHDLLISIKYEATTNKFILHKYNDELAREAIVMPSKVTDIHLLLDKSSVEIFANEGEACFSERIYNEKKVYIETVSTSSDYSIEAYQLGHAI